MPAAKHIVVIGAGIVGTCTAVALLQRGHRVTVLDPDAPGGPQAASYGNGAFLSPASIIPMSFPGMWRKVPGYLCDPEGPLTIRWRYLPRLMPWLWRFLWAGATEARMRRTAGLLHRMLADAPARHRALAEMTGQADLIRQDGLMYAFADRAAQETEALGWRLRRDHGVKMRDLGRDEIARLIPGLSPHYGFGILITEGAHCTDPGAYVAGLAEWCIARGAGRVTARATGFDVDRGRITAVRTDAGPIACDAAVIAAGIGSAGLARAAGDIVPLEAERGYHVEIPNAGPLPAIPVMPQDGKMANTPVRGGLRASGQVELARAGAAPDWRRADVLLGHLLRTYPALAARRDALVIHRWQGNRPSTPDGIPVIGAARGVAGVFHAFGHGHVGLAAGPVTAEWIAAAVDGADFDPAYSARRFR